MFLATIRTNVDAVTWIMLTTPETLVDDLMAMCRKDGLGADLPKDFAGPIAEGAFDPADPLSVLAWWCGESDEIVEQIRTFDGSAEIEGENLAVVTLNPGEIKSV